MTLPSVRRKRSISALRLTLLAAVAGGALVLAKPGQTQNDSASEVVLYRTALDQLAAGKARHARLLLENSSRGRLAPESAALLAYLQERDGDGREAYATLERSGAQSPLALAYMYRLGQPATASNLPTNNSIAASSFVPVAAGGARLTTSDARIRRLENVMFRIVNEERKRNNLTDLAYDDRLAEVARAHSAEMRDKKYFAHESPTPSLKDPLDRYVAGMGARPRMVAENVYRAWGSRSFMDDADIQSAHKSLMNSPGHRANILQPGATRIGIGLTADATGNIWITQMFSRP